MNKALISEKKHLMELNKVVERSDNAIAELSARLDSTIQAQREELTHELADLRERTATDIGGVVGRAEILEQRLSERMEAIAGEGREWKREFSTRMDNLVRRTGEMRASLSTKMGDLENDPAWKRLKSFVTTLENKVKWFPFDSIRAQGVPLVGNGGLDRIWEIAELSFALSAICSCFQNVSIDYRARHLWQSMLGSCKAAFPELDGPLVQRILRQYTQS
jgi:hypothetical protein